jgi:pSer/pThr/pTyr-binding forkhead associated (FHA) protein
MAILLFEDGPLAGRRVTVTAEVEIGRSGSGLVVDDVEVSRRHAAVGPAEDGLEVEDLGSTNGTWVNDVRIEGRRRLTPGDVLRIGTSTIRIESDAAAPQSTAPVGTHLPASPSTSAATPALAAQIGVGAAAPRFAAPRSRRRAAATREPIAAILAVVVPVTVAIALILYFALR